MKVENRRVVVEIDNPGTVDSLILYVNSPDKDILKSARAVLRPGARIKKAAIEVWSARKEERLL